MQSKQLFQNRHLLSQAIALLQTLFNRLSYNEELSYRSLTVSCGLQSNAGRLTVIALSVTVSDLSLSFATMTVVGIAGVFVS